MEYLFDVNSVLQNEITILSGKKIGNESPYRSERERHVSEIVDTMGVASAKAQGLLSAITSYTRLNLNQEILYVLKGDHESKNRGVVIGIIKTGRRRLFLNDGLGQQHEVEPLSILDFYVHESRQKCGYGKKLFESVLKEEGLQAWEVAIDRPSLKFLNFLKKNYGLTKCINQANHYVVFDTFFGTCKQCLPWKSRFSLTCNKLASSTDHGTSQPSDRAAPKQVPSMQPTPPLAVDNKGYPLGEENSRSVSWHPLTSDCAKDENASKDLMEPQSAKGDRKAGGRILDFDTQAGSGGNQYTLGLGDKPCTWRGLEKTETVPETGVCHPHMNALRASTKYDAQPAVEASNLPKARSVGISSLATSGFGINGINALGITSFRAGGDSHTKCFGDVQDGNRNGAFGMESAANAQNESREELAPYLNMRQARNGRRKSDITSHGYSSPNYSAAASYSRHHHLAGNHHILNCTQPKSDTLRTSQFSSQTKSKETWRQFII